MKGSIHTNQIHTKQVVCHIANASKHVIENHPVGHAEKNWKILLSELSMVAHVTISNGKVLHYRPFLPKIKGAKLN